MAKGSKKVVKHGSSDTKRRTLKKEDMPKHTLMSQIERILKSYVRCRSNDLLLYAKLLNRYYGADIVDDQLMMDLNIVTSRAYPPMSSVIRARQEFQAKGWFTPSTNESKFKKHDKHTGKVSADAVKRLKKIAKSEKVK